MATLEDDEQAPSYVLALFPFSGQDASSLSFNRGDIIEVYNRLPSGWWDGVLDGERGWFPSNYVREMPEREVMELLATRELEETNGHAAQANAIVQSQAQAQQQRQHPQIVQAQTRDVGRRAVSGGRQNEQYWDDRASDTDYWVPEVSANGQIYYVNPVTGQQSIDLPTDDPEPAHHAALAQSGHHGPHINTNIPHTHSRTTTSNGGSYMIQGGRQRSDTTNSAASSSRVDPISATTYSRPGTDLTGSYSSSALSTATSGGLPQAGFGMMHRSETPEPWEKRLADDGLAYYYVNTITKESRWTRPEPMEYSSGPITKTQHPTRQQLLQGQGQYSYNPYSNQSQFQPRGNIPQTRNRTDSEASFSGRERDNRRASVYSDDSEVSPLGKGHGINQASDTNNLNVAAGGVRPLPTPGGEVEDIQNGTANPLKIAVAIQNEVKPGPLPPLTLYSDRACEAIGAVVEAYVESNAPGSNATDGTNTSLSGTSNGGTSVADGEEGSRDRTSLDAQRIQTMADRVALVVVAVRNLLYVSGTLTGALPNLGGTGNPNNALNGGLNGLNQSGLNGVGAGLTEDVDWVRQEIKPFQRKVTATLSKLVLSARAVNANPDWPIPGGSGQPQMGRNARVESDAAELERAVTTFVFQIQRTAASSRAKRLYGVMLPGEGSSGIGPGLIGAGVAGGWKGAGFVPISENSLTGGPERRLGREVVAELANLRLAAEEKMSTLRIAVEAYKSALASFKSSSSNTNVGYDSRPADLVMLNGRLTVAHITDFLLHAEDIHIAAGVDVMGTTDDDEEYLAGVKRARELIRTWETAKQSIYDDGSVLLMASQAVHVSSLGSSISSSSTLSGPADVLLLSAIPALQSNLGTVMETLELLLDVAHQQDEVIQARHPMPGESGYHDDPYAHLDPYQTMLKGQRISTSYNANDIMTRMGIQDFDYGNGETVDIGDILGGRSNAGPGVDVYRNRAGALIDRDSMDGGIAASDKTGLTVGPATSVAGTNVSSTVVAPAEEDSDDSDKAAIKKREDTLRKKFGDLPSNYITEQKQKQMPAYLQLDHTSPSEIVLNPDGAVRAGTLPALIERLTMHSGSDARFNDTFMMTFKSFATIDQVFDMLVERYNIQPPEGLTPEQIAEWTKAKKTPIRLRSINTMRKLIDVLEKEDLHILDRFKTFANDVITNDPDRAGVAKTLLHIVQRVEKNGIESKRTMHAVTSDFPPPSILPRKPGKIKLLDVDPLELARQLTIMESELFFKIKQSECIARSKESQPVGPDNIKSVITVTNKMADWVADAVLSKEDPRRRAAVIKHFIQVAERCRHLANYSSMAALIAGLNCPPIRRLKRTWEQVTPRNTAILDDLEKTLDTAHNFQGYKALISGIPPPCVPFLGVYLTVLTFIQDGAKDTLKEGGLINFQKRQKTADVIQEITKFQGQPYNLTKLPAIRNFIDESLLALDNVPDFWNLSLEREPREREDEKMARLLQESGFL